MSKIISFQSFSRGTGKSNIIANIAAILAKLGMRVGVIDTDLLSPSAHILFNLATEEINKTWTHYLWGEASVEEIVYDVTPKEKAYTHGKIYLVPASAEINLILYTLREGVDAKRINQGFINIFKKNELDFLLIDTHSGISEETLTTLAISDMLFVVMRLDQQSYQGTSLLIDMGHQLGVKHTSLLLNDIPIVYDIAEMDEEFKENYDYESFFSLPHSPQMLEFGSRGIFIDHYPENSLANGYLDIALKIMSMVEKK